MNEHKKVSFTVYRKYFDDIVARRKTLELRNSTPFWHRRLIATPDPPKIAVFVCGRNVYRCEIVDIREGTFAALMQRGMTKDEKAILSPCALIGVFLGEQVLS